MLLFDYVEYCFENHERIQRKHSEFQVTPAFMTLLRAHLDELRKALFDL